MPWSLLADHATTITVAVIVGGPAYIAAWQAYKARSEGRTDHDLVSEQLTVLQSSVSDIRGDVGEVKFDVAETRIELQRHDQRLQQLEMV